ncbi:hypothetical protein D3C71_1684670 [compost metagenome]
MPGFYRQVVFGDLVGGLGFEHSGEDRHRTAEVSIGIQHLVALVPQLRQGRVAALFGVYPAVKILISLGHFCLGRRDQACG